jgi:hypothetical protein
MTTEPKIKRTVFPPELWNRVVDYRFEHRIPSEMAAIRELIDRGLATAGQTGEPSSATRTA